MTRLHLAMAGGLTVLGAQALSGWAGLPVSMIPLLAGIAVLQIVLTRRRRLWRDPARLAGIGVLNLAVAGVLHAVGHGLALLTGPLALSALVVTMAACAGCALAAWAWPSQTDAALDDLLTDAARHLDRDP